jgi:hypothetical protein
MYRELLEPAVNSLPPLNWNTCLGTVAKKLEEFHPQHENTIRWPVWLTCAWLQSCSMMAQNRMFRLQPQIHLFRAYVWFRFQQSTENAYELCNKSFTSFSRIKCVTVFWYCSLMGIKGKKVKQHKGSLSTAEGIFFQPIRLSVEC